jgi:hypothetical protein
VFVIKKSYENIHCLADTIFPMSPQEFFKREKPLIGDSNVIVFIIMIHKNVL